MREVVKKYKVYRFEELSKTAKENVKRWYRKDFSWQIDENLMEDFDCQLDEAFPNSLLKVQWSISGCQGDGVNIYGDLDLQDYVGDEEIAKDEVMERCEVELRKNMRYCYSLKKQDLKDTISDVIAFVERAMPEYVNLNGEGVQQIEEVVKNLFKKLEEMEKSFERQIVESYYEMTDEEMGDTASANEWEFLEDGKLWKE